MGLINTLLKGAALPFLWGKKNEALEEELKAMDKELEAEQVIFKQYEKILDSMIEEKKSKQVDKVADNIGEHIIRKRARGN